MGCQGEFAIAMEMRFDHQGGGRRWMASDNHSSTSLREVEVVMSCSATLLMIHPGSIPSDLSSGLVTLDLVTL